MIGEVNLKPIKMGDTYVIPFEFYQDECEEVSLDVSDYLFTLTAQDKNGVNQFTWYNSDFVEVALNKRTVTLTNEDTQDYLPGEFVYELQVDTGSGIYTWMQGYIEVQDQITI